MSKTPKQLLSLVLKCLIVTCAFWFMYREIIAKDDLAKFFDLLKGLPAIQIQLVLGFLSLLMLLNWGMEAYKWKILITPIERISIWVAISAVFCGLTWAIFTPNRIGEYGGRVFFMPPRQRVRGVIAMGVGSLSQLAITYITGLIALSLFFYRFNILDYRLCFAGFAVTTVLVILILVFFLHIKWLNELLLANRFTRSYKKFFKILSTYKTTTLLRILSISFFRYLVFTTQYLVLFWWLLPGLNPFEVAMLVSVFFFVKSSLPSFDLIDVGIRSVTAVYFFKYITDQTYIIVAIVASIWLINLIIPAILGSYFVFKLNFFGSDTRS